MKDFADAHPILIATCIAFTLVAVSIVLEWPDQDIFDHFEVIQVTSEPAVKRHAVTFDYRHANSSRRVVGTWIASGPPPPIGSTTPPRGDPVVIWTGGPEKLFQKWVRGRLEVSTDVDSDVRQNRFYECYFEEGEKPMLCFDAKHADYVEVR